MSSLSDELLRLEMRDEQRNKRARRNAGRAEEIVYHGAIPTRSAPVNTLDLSVRVLNVCHAYHIETCGQLADAMATDAPRRWRNFANASHRDVLEALTHFKLWPVVNGFEDGAGI